MMSDQPIGVFDSGVGGTSIWKDLRAVLPFEDTIYLADSRNAPYGERSPEEILQLSIKNTEYLISRSCKLVVVACNTATTNAIAYLREHYNIPFIGIEPAIKPAALQTKTGAVGILATRGTLSSALFAKTSDLFASAVTRVEQVGDGLVPLIEQGKINSPEMTSLLKRYLEPMIAAKIDHLVLGCTHYPYLRERLRELLPEGVIIIDSGEAVARQTKRVLENANLINPGPAPGRSYFYTNSDPALLRMFLSDVQGAYTLEYLDF